MKPVNFLMTLQSKSLHNTEQQHETDLKASILCVHKYGTMLPAQLATPIPFKSERSHASAIIRS